MPTMGERIRQLRKANGFTQTGPAEQPGVTKSTVSARETGRDSYGCISLKLYNSTFPIEKFKEKII